LMRARFSRTAGAAVPMNRRPAGPIGPPIPCGAMEGTAARATRGRDIRAGEIQLKCLLMKMKENQEGLSVCRVVCFRLWGTADVDARVASVERTRSWSAIRLR